MAARAHGQAAVNAGSIEGMKSEASKVFDTPGSRPSAAQMNQALSGANVPQPAKPVPAALANNQDYQTLNQRKQDNQRKLDQLNQQLAEAQKQRQNSTGTTQGNLTVQEAQIKQQISNVNNDNNFVQYKLRDMEVKFVEDKPAPAQPSARDAGPIPSSNSAASASSGLQSKLEGKAGSDQGQSGGKGQPGMARNDGTVPNGLPGLPGTYTGSPGEGSRLTNSARAPQTVQPQGDRPQTGSASSAAGGQPSAATGVAHNQAATAAPQIKPSDSGAAPSSPAATLDPGRVNPQQLANTPAAGPTGTANVRQPAAVANPSNNGAVRPGPQSMAAAALPTGPAIHTTAPPPPWEGTSSKPREYKNEGNGLIGGTTWIYGYNVPPGSNPAVRTHAEEALRTQMKLAGVNEREFVNTKDYNFILGMAASHSAATDLRKRVKADDASEGEYTVEHQPLYASLRGRQFNRLDCHSNGAMICLAALTREDARAEHVRLFGPQITQESLADWQRLINEGKVKDVQLYINRGDPVPGVSYLGTHKTAVSKLLLNDSLREEIHRDAPGIRVQFNDCPDRGFFLDLKCHDMQLYQRNVDSPTK